MAFSQISGIAPNYRDYKSEWLKAYKPGTTTPKAMSDNDTGSPSVAKYQLNKDGFPVSSGGAIVTPFIDGDYDLWLFPTEVEADNNDTSNAIRVADDLSSPGSNIGGYASYEFNTVIDAQNGITIGGQPVTLKENDVIRIKERGGALFDVVAGTLSANGYNIIAHNTLDLSFVLRDLTQSNIIEYGAVGDGVSDDTMPIQLALDSATSTTLIPATTSTYMISSELTVPDYKQVIGEGWNSKINQSTQDLSVFIAGDGCFFSGLHPKVIDGTNADFVNCFSLKGVTTGTVENCFMELSDNGCCGVFAQNSKQLTIKNNMIYGGRWDGITGGAAATAADILFYSSSASARHIIEGNMSLSNNSQGIFVDALGYDADVAVSNNICITLDPVTCVEGGAWSEVPLGGVRRHGIMVGYVNSSVAGTRCTINNNLCKNTTWTGIYKQGNADGAISITDNVCTYNGYQTNNALSAGIYVNLSGNEHITGNTIEAFQNDDESGVGGIVLNSDTVNNFSILVSDNKIKESKSHGIFITTRASYAEVNNNHIIESAYTGISIVNIAGGGHIITDNFISKTSGLWPGVDYSKQSATIESVMKGNTIEGYNNTTNDTMNSGVRTSGDTSGFLRLEENYIKNFYYGYSSGQFWSGRVTTAVFRGNTIEDCNTGYNISAVDNNQTVPIVGAYFNNVTTKVAGTLGGTAARLVQQEGDRYVWESSSTPTNGSWIVGDRAYNTAPAASGNIGWVCVADGSPGTWKSYGNIDA